MGLGVGLRRVLRLEGVGGLGMMRGVGGGFGRSRPDPSASEVQPPPPLYKIHKLPVNPYKTINFQKGFRLSLQPLDSQTGSQTPGAPRNKPRKRGES